MTSSRATSSTRVAPLVGATATLGPHERRRALRELREREFDVVVVGGGVTGLGTALDAATRGLRVALLEYQDLGAGTSSRSSKLIHGGLRYLQQLEFGLVRQSLQERALLLRRLAPHLVQPVPFLFPLHKPAFDRLLIGAGVGLYDLLGGAGALPRHRHLRRSETLRAAPALRSEGLRGAVHYWDAQVDDARYTVALARSAARCGAVLATRIAVTGLLREGNRVVGVRAREVGGGSDVKVRARCVVNAAGVWAGEVDRMATGATPRIRPSKGVHLLVARDRIDARSALITRTATSVLLVIPWGQHWIIGTTDTDWPNGAGQPTVEREDVDYLLSRLNELLRIPLGYDDVVGAYAGLRPLVTGGAASTSSLSRDHVVSETVPGMLAISGGKFTTYRIMAKDVIDAVAARLDRPVPPSSTHEHPLEGAAGFVALWNARAALAEAAGLPLPRIEHLLRRYGTDVADLLDLIYQSPELGNPLPGASDYLAVEVVYGASHEGALDLEDILTRRTRIAIETRDAGSVAAPAVAELLGDVLGWDAAEVDEEVERYRASVHATGLAAVTRSLDTSDQPCPAGTRERSANSAYR